MKIFKMMRGGEQKAQVVVLDSGKCIVSWPTSVIVYDNEKAARDVHITHMGGRGEPTEFVLDCLEADELINKYMPEPGYFEDLKDIECDSFCADLRRVVQAVRDRAAVYVCPYTPEEVAHGTRNGGDVNAMSLRSGLAEGVRQGSPPPTRLNA